MQWTRWGITPIEDEGCTSVSLRSGTYKLLVKAIVYGNEVRMASTLTCLLGTEDVKLGEKIAETGTDSGTIGVYDFRTFSQVVNANPEAT